MAPLPTIVTARSPSEHLDRLRGEGFLRAPIPSAFGGGGVDSIHDVLVAMSRLARGDAATSIGVNMHFAVLLNVVRRWRIAIARGATGQADALRGMLQMVTAADVVFATAVSEPSPQDLTRPSTTAVRVEGGWRIDGRKIFATMAPAATTLNVAVTYRGEDGTERYGFALVPSSAPGVEIPHDWDALGMRASESGSVTFRDVRVGPDGLRDGFPAGSYSAAMLDRFLVSGGFHAAASLGIAESAHARVIMMLRHRADATLADAHAVMRVAENVVELAAMRAVFDRAGRLIDEYHAAFPEGDAELADAQSVYGEVQAAKAHITEAGSRVVDRALALSGGAGYMAGNPLSKAWRDARAGALHAPARRQPRLRLPRPYRPRRRSGVTAVLDHHALRSGVGLAPPEPAAGAGATRVLLAGVAFAAAIVGVAMLVAPGSTGRYFSWQLAPAPLAALVGACYLASATVFGWAAFRERWAGQRGLVVAVLGLAGPTLVATARHHDVFDFGRWQAVAWVLLFAASVTSFGTLAIVRRRQPAAGSLVLRPAGRAALAALAGIYAGAAATLWADPYWVSEHGPIAAGPLGLRFMGSWAAFLAIGAAYAATHRSWEEARMNVLALAVFPLAALGATVAHVDELRAGRPTVLWVMALVALTAIGAAVAMAGRGSRVVSPPDPA